MFVIGQICKQFAATTKIAPIFLQPQVWWNNSALANANKYYCRNFNYIHPSCSKSLLRNSTAEVLAPLNYLNISDLLPFFHPAQGLATPNRHGVRYRTCLLKYAVTGRDKGVIGRFHAITLAGSASNQIPEPLARPLIGARVNQAHASINRFDSCWLNKKIVSSAAGKSKIHDHFKSQPQYK